MQTGMPFLKCFLYHRRRYETNDGEKGTAYRIKAWCPYCQKWHYHGHSILDNDPQDRPIRGGTNLGHCVAHCGDSNSPFKDTGYELKLMTKAEIKEMSNSLWYYK